MASIVSAETRLHYYGNTTCWKAANQTSNKKPPNSAVFYCLKKLILRAQPVNLPVRPIHSSAVVQFHVWHIQRRECQQNHAAVTPEPQLTIIGLS